MTIRRISAHVYEIAHGGHTWTLLDSHKRDGYRWHAESADLGVPAYASATMKGVVDQIKAAHTEKSP